MSETPSWLSVTSNDAPLIVSMPHTGTDIPPDLESRFVSCWLARKDADWWIERLYDFAPASGGTIIRTLLSRSVIDVNRDPGGHSLYPGQHTTELCPTTTFDGEALYRVGFEPHAEEVARRRASFFEPYHNVLADEIARLRSRHANIVLLEAHSIRSRIPRLFESELPHFNIGTNSGQSCARELTAAIEKLCDASSSHYTRITDGRFKGGYTTRHYGQPKRGVHAIQLELAMRAYMDEPAAPAPENWPSAYVHARAAPLRVVLQGVLVSCLNFARAT